MLDFAGTPDTIILAHDSLSVKDSLYYNNELKYTMEFSDMGRSSNRTTDSE